MTRIRFFGVAAVAVVLLVSPPALAGAEPEVGSSAAGVRLSSAVTLTAGGYAIPLRGARPDWYTASLHRELQASGTLAAPVQAPLPSTIGIRPGAWMIAPAGCTMNFVFQQGESYAIGTAGHCVSRVGEAVTLLTLAPGTRTRSWWMWARCCPSATTGSATTSRSSRSGPS